MSALALVLHGEGYKVQGSILEQYSSQKDWKKLELHYYHSALTILKKRQVVAGNAFPDSHEELVSAREKGAEVARYHKNF